MPSRRDLYWPIAIAATCLVPLALLPFTVTYWPNEDNANQLAVAHILLHHGDPPWSDLFDVRWAPKPYMLHYYLLVLLGRFVDMATADKMLISLATLALPLSSLWLIRCLAPDRWKNGYLLFPLTASCYALNRGFTAYVFGLATVQLAVGLVAAARQRWLAICVILTVSTLFHPYAAILGLGMAALWLLTHGRRDRLLHLALAFLPSAALFVSNQLAVRTLSLPQPPAICVAPFLCPRIHADWNPLLLITTLGSFSWWEILIRGAALGLLLAGAAREARRRTGPAGNRVWFYVLGAGFFLVPFGVVGRLMHMNDRFVPLVYLGAAAAADLRGWWSERTIALSAMFLCLVLAVEQHHSAAIENREIEQIVHVGRAMRRGAKLLYLNHHENGEMALALPQQSAWGYILIERDIVVPYLFADGLTTSAGAVGYRPLVFRDPAAFPWGSVLIPYPELVAAARHYDYLMEVGADPEQLTAVSRDFRLVSREGDVWLFATGE